MGSMGKIASSLTLREGDVAVVIGVRSSTAPHADHYWCTPLTYSGRPTHHY